MKMKIRLLIGLLSATMLLAVACAPTPPFMAERKSNIRNTLKKMGSECPTKDQMIDCWYKNTPPGFCGNSSLSDWKDARLPFDQKQSTSECLDVTEQEWCGCVGADCFSKKSNKRISVELTGLQSWRITFENPATIDIHKDLRSSCFQVAHKIIVEDYSTFPPTHRVEFVETENKNIQIFPRNGKTILEFSMPPFGEVFPGSQICMWSIKMGNDTYHEHFATNETCYGWIEVLVTPLP